MSRQIDGELFTKTIHALFEETFDKVEGYFLDRGTSLLETLAPISASEASYLISGNGTTIAGHIAHVHFYIQILGDYIDGKLHEKVDWKQSWLVKNVNDAEWDSLRRQLGEDCHGLQAKLGSITDWNDENRLGGALAIIAHTAYHLGAIRQMLRAIKR
jgi:hypothetical protein